MKRKPVFIRQQGSTDCGVTCLLTVIRMHGGDAPLETLRIDSGISLQGTNLLGLQQAAQKQNLLAEVFEVEDLAVFKKEATFPCILHVVPDKQSEHFVVCYGIKDDRFFIIDPARGVASWSEAELLNQWKSRAVILLEPTPDFTRTKVQQSRKITWFKNLIREDLSLLFTALVMGMLIAVSGLGMAVFSQQLVDDILPRKLSTQLWTGTALLALVLLVRGMLNYLRTTFLLRQSKAFNKRLTDDFYHKLLHLPKRFFDSRKTGDVIARIHDTRRIQTMISYFTGNVLIDLLVGCTSLCFIFMYSVPAGLTGLVSLPVFGLMVWAWNKRILRAQKDTMAHYAMTESHFVDTISGMEAVKSSGTGLFFFSLGQKVYHAFQEQIFRLGRLGSRYNLLIESLNTVFIIGIMAYAAYEVLEDHLLPGEMMAVLSLSTGMLGAFTRLCTFNIQLQEARVAFERMFEFAAIETEKDPPDKAYQHPEHIESIDFEHVSFGFPGKRELLKSITFSAKRGEITAISGEIGSGKSMILQLLQKFQEHDRGEIMINAALNLNNISYKVWRSKLGVMPQDVKLFNGTVLDNIVLGDVSTEAEKAIAFCREYGLSFFFERLPQSYFTLVGEDGIKLSGGQKQLVALARALYNNPGMLLLDEPTSAMDKKTEAYVMHLLETLKHDKIILMISHKDTLSKYADVCYSLKNGVISLETTQQEMAGRQTSWDPS